MEINSLWEPYVVNEEMGRLGMKITGHTSPVTELKVSLLPTELWPRCGQDKARTDQPHSWAEHGALKHPILDSSESLGYLSTVEFLPVEGTSSGQSLECW